MKYTPFYLLAAIFATAYAINQLTENKTEANGGFSLIGKRYIPSDNSYAKCLDSGCNAHVWKKEFICLSEPYTKEIHPDWDKDLTLREDMIKVFSLRSGRMYEVLFSESDIVED